MTATRRLILAAAAALPLALVACDNKCPTQTPDINSGGVPVCIGGNAVKAGAAVTVRLQVCPRCDQAYDQCTVTLPSGDNIIQLDPLVQVCNADPSCPLHPGCNYVDCTFTAPATPGRYQLLVDDGGTGTYVIPDPEGVSPTPVMPPLDVAAAGQTTCAG